ncbi:hypothetical protein ACOBQX_08225 [Actinokineospora sp. G85]|uniref:hypothetical protein n=1 Tax=Actinokineospora sp. G85 TaxID=3406626 RepID=UPI003C783616
MDGALLRDRDQGLAARYPDRKLVLFAVREDRDDVACWDLDTGGVAELHDFASPGSEQRRTHRDFRTWFTSAIQEFFEFDE